MLKLNNKLFETVFFIVLFLFVLFIQGAIPFFAMPTLGQAIWTTGFAQSLANYSLLTVYANNIGAPSPAAIAFGLAGAWPVGGLIKLGLHPADAYSSIAVFWFGVAYFSAYRISRFFGVKSIYSTLLACLWLTMPTIWAHAGYSMLSWGIALLSFYYYRALKLLLNENELRFNLKTIYYSILYFLSTVISIFMDGYTFMMFAVGVSILIAYIVVFIPIYRRNVLFVGIPVHLLSLLFSYLMYTNYVETSNFDLASIDFFRGWGVDLSFIAIPSKGMLWLFDTLGLSIKRTDELYFGDKSVWITTFCLPIILIGIFSWWKSRKSSRLSSGLFIVAIIAFYMSLGPSLKINSIRTVEMLQTVPKNMTPLMSPELAIIPTGSAWISENLPGFNTMRASYRWSALGIFACWLLFSLYLSKRSTRNNFIFIGGIVVIILCNLPNLYNSWKEHTTYRSMFMDIDNKLVAKLQGTISPNSIVAFLPYQNDFMINYLASKLNIKTYNIGGDKNITIAKKRWPLLMLDPNISLDEKIIGLLLNKDADAIVIPYFDTLWSAHFWPCQNNKNQDSNGLVIDNSSDCFEIKKKEFSVLVDEMKTLPYLSVIETDLFSVVKINPKFLAEKELMKLKVNIMKDKLSEVNYPIIINPKLHYLSSVLKNWNGIEPAAVWSKDISTINLPIPSQCQNNKCSVVLDFDVLNASIAKPVVINFSTKNAKSSWNQKLTLVKNAPNEVSIPLSTDFDFLTVTIEVIDAKSPKELGINGDDRILGIYLRKIDLKEE